VAIALGHLVIVPGLAPGLRLAQTCMGTWTRSLPRSGVSRASVSIVMAALALGGSARGGSAQAVPTETPTPTSAVAAVTATATPTETPTPAVAVVTATATPTVAPTPFSSGVPCAIEDPNTSGNVRRSYRRGYDEEGEGNNNEFATGNGRNEVIVHNCADSRLRVRASIQLNTIPGRKVAPLNLAYAEGSCRECQTLAVALQIDLYSGERANDVQPENYAVAINNGCTHCVTVARAVQYVQPVDDPREISQEIQDTVAELDHELRSVQGDPNIGLLEAEARLNAVLARFAALGGTLGDQREEHDD
jgi:hypothetical protein